MEEKNKRTSFCVSKQEYDYWEEIMFKEKCRSISSFIRKCVKFYIQENYGNGSEV
jgi:hypothetical protein